MMFCVGCGKKGVRWPTHEPIACTMRCLATQWMILSEAGGDDEAMSMQALPYLLGLFGGEQGGGQEFDPRSYFQ